MHFRYVFDGRLGILKGQGSGQGQIDMTALVHGVSAWFQSQELYQFEVGVNVTRLCVCMYIQKQMIMAHVP